VCVKISSHHDLVSEVNTSVTSVSAVHKWIKINLCVFGAKTRSREKMARTNFPDPWKWKVFTLITYLCDDIFRSWWFSEVLLPEMKVKVINVNEW